MMEWNNPKNTQILHICTFLGSIHFFASEKKGGLTPKDINLSHFQLNTYFKLPKNNFKRPIDADNVAGVRNRTRVTKENNNLIT